MVKKKKDNPINTIKELAPAFFSLALTGIALNIASKNIKEAFMSEERIHLSELKLVGATFVSLINKDKIERVYLPIGEEGNYIKSFMKKNKKYVLEKIEVGKLYKKDKEEMFYNQLRRIYKPKPYKNSEIERCHECGRYIDDYD